ncbi:MAG: type II secretion system F family protein [Arenibacterium sp.]
MSIDLWLEQLGVAAGVPVEYLVAAGVLSGALLLFAGLLAILGRPNHAAERIAAGAAGKRRARHDKALLLKDPEDVSDLIKPFLPKDRLGRSRLQLKLQQAGYTSASAVQVFTAIRICLGLGLPLFFLGLVIASRMSAVTLPSALESSLRELSLLQTYTILTVLIGLGYFCPMKFVNDKVAERRVRIENSFPNALDLLRIAAESGLGFDAAMTRVGNELEKISPDVAFEFLTVQRQVAAGRPREDAMRDLTERCDVDVVRSFATVVQQSLRFGSSISDALTSYAEELREKRENKAQELANKLPVKMSIVLGLLMLPALILLAVGPTIIRYSEMF